VRAACISWAIASRGVWDRPTVCAAEMTDEQEPRPETLAAAATSPARWLLELGGDGGVPLTQTHALARTMVREAAERWPDWWDADLFGPPHREADMFVLGELREGLVRQRLLRRRGEKLLATTKARTLAGDPLALLYQLASELGAGDPFQTMVAGVVVDVLDAEPAVTHDRLVEPAHEAAQWGWRGPDGSPPDERGVSHVVSHVLARAEAYGLIERHPDPQDSTRRRRPIISLSPAARFVLGRSRPLTAGRAVLSFDAELVNAPGVGASIAVAAYEHVTALHDAIGLAFGWADDHLYSFWLDGEFWGDKSSELVRPGTPDAEAESRTALLPNIQSSRGLSRELRCPSLPASPEPGQWPAGTLSPSTAPRDGVVIDQAPDSPQGPVDPPAERHRRVTAAATRPPRSESVDEPPPDRGGDRGGSVGRAQLAIGVFEVGLDRGGAERQLLGDLRGRGSLRGEPEDLELAGGEGLAVQVAAAASKELAELIAQGAHGLDQPEGGPELLLVVELEDREHLTGGERREPGRAPQPGA